MASEGKVIAVLEDAITRSFGAFGMKEAEGGIFSQGDLYVESCGCEGFFAFFERGFDGGGVKEGALMERSSKRGKGGIAWVEQKQTFVGKQRLEQIGEGITDGAVRGVVLFEDGDHFVGEREAVKGRSKSLKGSGKGGGIECIVGNGSAPCEGFWVFESAQGQDLPVVLGETASGDLGEIVVFDLEPKQRNDGVSRFGLELSSEKDGGSGLVEGVKRPKKEADLLACDDDGGSFLGEGVEVGLEGRGAFFRGILRMKQRKQRG